MRRATSAHSYCVPGMRLHNLRTSCRVLSLFVLDSDRDGWSGVPQARLIHAAHPPVQPISHKRHRPLLRVPLQLYHHLHLALQPLSHVYPQHIFPIISKCLVVALLLLSEYIFLFKRSRILMHIIPKASCYCQRQDLWDWHAVSHS